MNDILKALECSTCQQILNVPVLLPCTHSICKVHVDEAQTETDTIWCLKCDLKHQIPIDVGFTRIEALQHIISTQIVQSPLAAELKETLSNCHKLNEYATNMENLIHNPLNLVHDELQETKNLVLLSAEEIKLKIDNEATAILNKIESYKDTYLNNKNAYDFQDALRKLNSNINKIKTHQESLKEKLTEFDFFILLIY